MKLTFRIEYRTAWGEELGVILDGNNSEPIILRTPNGEHWEGEAEMPDLPACVPVSYRYGVYRDGQCIRRESGTMAHLFCPGKKKNCHYILNDFWKDLPAESYLYSSAFSGDYQSEAAIKSQQAPMEALLSGPYALACIISIKCWLSAGIARL